MEEKYFLAEIKWVKKFSKEKFKSLGEALRIQAKEYERRLGDLNHEAARIKASQDLSISVEKFDGFDRQINSDIHNLEDQLNRRVSEVDNKYFAIVDSLKKDIKELSNYKTTQQGSTKIVMWFVTGLTAIVVALIIFYITKGK